MPSKYFFINKFLIECIFCDVYDLFNNKHKLIHNGKCIGSRLTLWGYWSVTEITGFYNQTDLSYLCGLCCMTGWANFALEYSLICPLILLGTYEGVSLVLLVNNWFRLTSVQCFEQKPDFIEGDCYEEIIVFVLANVFSFYNLTNKHHNDIK